MSAGWKTIVYRGGLVTFRIPHYWVEETNEEEGIFHLDNPGSPTLFLRVLTLKSPSPVDDDTHTRLLSGRREAPGAPIRRLPSGNACLAYSTPAEDRGAALVIYRWEIANIVPPYHARLAMFSYATLASQQDTIADELRWLDREITACQFACELGVLP